jgi:transcriptional regulator of met regulon
MMERKLHSRSFSLVRDVDAAGLVTSFMRAEANNASQETELDRTIVELNEEVNSVNDRQVNSHSDSSNNVIMSESQFHKFMSTVMKEFDDLKARMRSEKTKLSESIKAVTDEMSIKIEIANKNLSYSLTKQIREEHASHKKEFSSKLKSEISLELIFEAVAICTLPVLFCAYYVMSSLTDLALTIPISHDFHQSL